MHHSPLVRWIVLLAVVMLVAPAPALAGQADAPVQQTNLINNPGFESGFYAQNNNGDITVGNSWAAWHEDSGGKPSDGSLNYVLRPKWVSENNPALVHGGTFSQHIGNFYDPWHAGVMQTVSVPAGSVVRLTAYGQVYTSNSDYPANDSGVDARMRVGIDPNGQGLWNASSIVWSSMGNPHLTWQAFTVDATVGSAGKVTVFLAANFRGGTSLHIDTWWDDVSLTVVATNTATTVPTVTAPPCAPGPFVLPTPQADGRIIYTVRTCDSLWSIAANVGLTLEQIRALNNFGPTVRVVTPGQQLVIGMSTPSAPPTEAATAAAATATPEGAVAPTATQESVAASETGTVCVLLYDDANGNGLRDSGEGLVAGGLITASDASGIPVDGYTTTGVETEPKCFADLAAGSYTISVGIPDGYNPTTSTSFPLPLEPKSVVNLEFGAQQSGEGGASDDLSDSGRLRTALFGAAGIVFLLLAAGVAGYLVLSRRR